MDEVSQYADTDGSSTRSDIHNGAISWWGRIWQLLAIVLFLFFFGWQASHFVESRLNPYNLNIDFRRYDEHGVCNTTGLHENQIGRTSHLQNYTCKSWPSPHTQNFSSLYYTMAPDSKLRSVMRHLPQLLTENFLGLNLTTHQQNAWRWEACTITVFSDVGCRNSSVTFGAIANMNQCATWNEDWQGRSVQLTCPEDNKENVWQKFWDRIGLGAQGM